ncbi:MAG TPA: beta-propeller fold lactonase family protein [Terriglobales bacterium]|nr:beta-propeller fold lactonase family protein [Terriglobales bacterium]
MAKLCSLVILFFTSLTVFAQTTGGIYVNGNTAPNKVWAYARASDGTLTFAGSFGTGGSGSGITHLDSQGSIALSQDGKFLFAVNAISNDITAFSVQTGARLKFVGKFPSGGTFPNSLAVSGNLLYVINSGSDQINAFHIGLTGRLLPISNSCRSLSGTGVDGAQVSFSPDGKILVVVERLSSKIDVFNVGTDGRATGPIIANSKGPRPLGFAFDNAGHIVVSEVQISAASSYSVTSSGVTLITGSLKDFGLSACWTVTTNDPSLPNQYSYITNTQSDTVSGYVIQSDGSLTLLNPTDGITAQMTKGAFPLDEALSADSKYLYVLGGHLPGVVGYAIQPDGSLVQITTVTGTPATSFGMTGN